MHDYCSGLSLENLIIMRLTATILMLLTAAFIIDARTNDALIPVHGMVMDRDTKEGIPDAIVTIFHEDHEISTCTDSTGYFVINTCRCEACHVSAYHNKYIREGSTELDISDNTPFIRIDLSREHTEELTEKIQRLIEMADCTYFEQERISRSFEEEITQIKRQGKILRTAGSLHKSTGSCSDYLKSTKSEINSGMIKSTEYLICQANESLFEFYGRKTRDIRRLSNRIKASRKTTS